MNKNYLKHKWKEFWSVIYAQTFSNSWLWNPSYTCIKSSPLGEGKNGLIRQVTS